MFEALARVRNDSILVRPAKASPSGRGIVWRLAAGTCSLPARVYVGAAFSALLAGIGVNALLLQHERRHEPFFAPTPRHFAPVPSNPAPVRAPASAAGAPDASLQAPTPPPSPAKTAAAGETAVHPPDPIGDLLRGEPRGDDSRAILAAQSALAKLGYSVKADGVEGAATEQALRDFERSRGLPVATEVTPHLVRQLTAAARAAVR